jgi:hypothetical protein
MSVNGTYQFGKTNSWGVSSVFQIYDNVAHMPPPPDEEYFLMTFFGLLAAVGLYFLGKSPSGEDLNEGNAIYPSSGKKRETSLYPANCSYAFFRSAVTT